MRSTYQVRFVVACRGGHIQDFPWVEWLFQNPNPAWKPDGTSRWLRMRTSGSASLAGVVVTAEEPSPTGAKVIEKRTLAGVFDADFSPNSTKKTPLEMIGVSCTGINPVLAIGSELRPATGCGEPLFALLRNASNLYFPKTVSSIFVPEIEDGTLSQDLLDLLDDPSVKELLREAAFQSDDGLISEKACRRAATRFRPDLNIDPPKMEAAANKHLLATFLLEDRPARTYIDQRIKNSIDGQLTIEMLQHAVDSLEWQIDPSILLAPVLSKLQPKASEKQGSAEESEETTYRRQEYAIFAKDVQIGVPKTDLDIRGIALDQYGDVVRDSLARVAVLPKLRETRAFAGFSRILPSGQSAAGIEQRRLFSTRQPKWLPATVVRGEGIFLEFSAERIADWIRQNKKFLDGRLELMRRQVLMAATRRGEGVREVSAGFVMIHTFAHLLINQLIYDCGYGSSSLRERIYSADEGDPMAGVLIYTAAGDSEGTMGGLVRMGLPDRLDDVISRALARARWCSADPVCIESNGQGPDNCNLAACHSCGLLPETSCEEQNRRLDRGLVVGTIEAPNSGFFSALISG